MAASNADEERGELEVRIISAANLAPKDADGKSDPYCRVACIEATRSRKRRTQTKSKELNPRWDERFFFADTAGDARVVIDVWDEDADGVDDLIGKVVIRLDGLARNELVEDTYEMIDGDVRVAVAFRPGVGDAAEDEAGAEDDEPMPLVPGGPDGETARSSQFYKLQQDSPHLLRELEKVAARLSASKGRLFEDEDFSGPRSIYIDPKRVPEDFLGGGTAEIAFLRPAEMPSQPVLFFTEAGDTKDIEPDDINQGQIGDCYLLAAIATIANEEHLIKDLLVEDHAALGVFGVKLFDWMGWHTVVVDSRFPCDARSKRQLFCHSDSGKEFWAACFEKAWAKYHGCYEAIEGGDTADTMAYLTGGRVDHISFDERPDHGSFWEEMLALFAINEGEEEDRCFLCASGARGSRGGKEDPESVPKEDPGGLVSGCVRQASWRASVRACARPPAPTAAPPRSSPRPLLLCAAPWRRVRAAVRPPSPRLVRRAAAATPTPCSSCGRRSAIGSSGCATLGARSSGRATGATTRRCGQTRPAPPLTTASLTMASSGAERAPRTAPGWGAARAPARVGECG